VRSRGSILLALAGLGALVGVLANAFLVGGSAADVPPAAPSQVTTGEVLAEVTEVAPLAEAAVAAPPAIVYAPDAREPLEPKLDAASYIAIDATTGEVIVARRDGRRLPIASLTKMMTALLVIENGRLGRKIEVTKAATMVEPNKEGLVAGETYTRRLLLYSLMLVSANDSADALAISAGRGHIESFYDRMNERAAELRMEDTTYSSASGLDDRKNLSTAFDQAILARVALQNETFAKIVATQRRVVDWPAPTFQKEWLNHNRLLGSYEGIYGVKTGFTTKAGACLVAAARRNGRDVIAVMLDAPSVWRDMPRLLDEAFRRLDDA
jgi:serine-type D-Ala-D-Ala carboxypeptidase (penicillin-binding protein 5/6)